jgi:hypothetical protein
MSVATSWAESRIAERKRGFLANARRITPDFEPLVRCIT